MRSVTSESLKLMQTLMAAGSTAIEHQKVLRVAVEKHVKKTAEAKAGEGVDRHLSGLLNLARIRQRSLPGYDIPELFRDPAWLRLRTDTLSTSNCGGYALASFGFGPVVPEGWGLGYIIKDKCFHVHITSFLPKRAQAYANALEATFNDIAQLLVNGTPIRFGPRPKL
jgi:carnitine O-acetyltransferase